ncbi:MAG: serine hydroxymethyltransferase [Rickettsiaceae bacterium]|nr:serine hydroxymethyltransferase [Rickettsiaceae bacterium]
MNSSIFKSKDEQIYLAIKNELARQQNSLELIASENFASEAVMSAQGSYLTNKYAEGFPGKRYYFGCEYVDDVERLAIERAKELFNCSYANVQPHSGSQANQAVFLSLIKPGDNVLAMDLSSGGHLTHGSSVNLSGKWFNFRHYGVNPNNYLIDYDEVEEIALEHKPKLIIVGYSAYSRIIDFARFRAIADKVGAFLLADMAHIAGLVAAGYHPSPLPYVDVATTTTHKTLRGPRGGLILSNNNDLGKKINSAIFPGIQGGPLMHVIAAKAIAFGEALDSSFKDYIGKVINNAKVMAKVLQQRGYDILTGGTDNHMLLVDLRKHAITGDKAGKTLDDLYITCNKNSIPFDITPPTVTSGVRLGSPACTTRGMGEEEFSIISHLIADVFDNINNPPMDLVRQKVLELCKRFPIYS